jgi:hypothetical protein
VLYSMTGQKGIPGNEKEAEKRKKERRKRRE